VPAFDQRHHCNENDIDKRIYADPCDQCHFPFVWCFHDLKFYTAKLQGNITQEQVRNVGGLVRKMEKELFSYGDRQRGKGLSRF